VIFDLCQRSPIRFGYAATPREIYLFVRARIAITTDNTRVPFSKLLNYREKRED
jgi:hypothetical protein